MRTDDSLTSSTQRRRFKLPRGGPDGNSPLPLIVGVLIGLVLVVSGGLITFDSSAPPNPISEFPVVSTSAVLEAASTGLVASVDFNSPLGVGSAEASRPVSTGPWVDALGRPVAAGDRVSFVAPAAVQAALMESLLADGVTVSFVNARVAPRSTGPRTATFSGVMGSGSTPDATASAYEDVGTKPWWLTGMGVFMLLVGIGIIAASIARHVSRRTAVKAEPKPIETVSTTFADVAGAAEAVDQMKELVDYLAHPEKYREMGAEIPKGALLVGPPGTGKTLLARALAGEAGVPIHTASGSQFVEMYVGVGARRVRDLFKEARKSPASIVFIDEIDAVARRRSDASNGNPHVESENTLIALLTEMDGFDENSSVVVIAATNRPDVLDPALTRPGRLDRRIEVPLPDRRGRQEILAVHMAKIKAGPDVDLELLARRTPGFSGAQLAAVSNEAALEAVRRGLPSVTGSCFDTAIAGVAMGRARASALVTEHDRRITAWHEAGHTVAALLLADADPPVSVSIVPRGPAGGVTWMAGTDDLFLTRAKAHARLVVALSGRAAERMLLGGEYTQGAAGDLQAATETALLMATRYGMTRLGLASRDQHLGGTTTTAVSEVVEELLAEAHDEATSLLANNRDLVARVAEELLVHEDLSSADLLRLAGDLDVVPASTPTPVPLPPLHGARPSSDAASPRTAGKVSRLDLGSKRRSLVDAITPWRRREHA